MRARALTGALLALLLLAGCNAPAAQTASPPPSEAPSESPLPSPEAGPQVVTHWDALTEKEKPVSTAKRLSEGPLDDFTPGNYGGVTLYLGGENRARMGEGENGEVYYETYYRYGLCAADGTILTDPVFDSVYRLSCYDQAAGKTQMLPVWVVTRTMHSLDSTDGWTRGDYYTAAGLVAADGSWYTGTCFRSGLMAVLGACRSSALVQVDAGSAALISLADGSELARYTPYDFAPELDAESAAWFFDDGLGWGMGCSGDYLYYDPARGGTTGEPVMLDGTTGQILAQPPVEIPQYEYNGRCEFDGGWYQSDENGAEFAQGGDLTLHYDDGREEVIQLTGELGLLNDVSADYLVFFWNDGENEHYYQLTDHALNVLFSSRGNMGTVELCRDQVTGRCFPCYSQVVDEETYTMRYILLSPRGEPLAVCDSYPRLYDGFVSFVDGAFYRLVELSGESCREVFRLPRWEALDLEMDE